ncbi:glycosyltransferase family 2 protein [Prevotella dentasini]|uniref:glycosyltransferase family 2 protein n=1 Tax=Prevotella dentasini TaxID=589537 RepID=UPI00046A6F76|nr:glycosyltransferase family 2 protein [Prevotella dentasini]
MITFTVVTITYNAADVLQPTLDSVMMQTYPHVEHLIVDGASCDATVKMAEAYKIQSDEAENGHAIKIKSEPDGGLYPAMNKGLERATGDYIVFLNAGDCFPAPDTLEQVVLAAEAGDGEERPAVLFGNTDIVNEHGNFLYHRRLQPPERLTWRSFRHGMLVCHQAFYARTDIAKQLPYDTQYKYSADVDWCIRVMKEGERRGLLLRNIHAVVANYMEEGQTTRHHKESLHERFDVMRRHYGLFPTVLFHLWFVVRNVIKKR